MARPLRLALRRKAFYPQYYDIGKAEHIKLDNEVGILWFFLAGPNSFEIVLPSQDRTQVELPNASEILVIGCEGEKFDALAVYVVAEDRLLLRDPFPDNMICPVPDA